MSKEVKQIPPRVENIVKGLFIVLLSVILTINVGKVGRTLAFPLVYLFGSCYYLIVEFFLFVGLFRIVRQEKIKIKPNINKVGLVLLFFGFLFIVGYASYQGSGLSYKGELGEALNRYNAQLATYYTDKTINLFDPNLYWSNGMIGTLFGGLVNNDGVVLFLGIALIVLSGVCFAAPNFIKRKKKDSKEKKEKPTRVNVEERREEVDDNPVIQTMVQKELEPAEIAPGFESEPAPFIDENSGFSQEPISLDEAFGNNKQVINDSEFSEFVPLSFDNDPFSFMNRQPKVTDTPVQADRAPVIEEVSEEENYIDSLPLTAPAEPVVVQEERELDEELVTMQPQFEEIEETKVDNSLNVVNPVEQVEVKKKRERVVWVPPSPDILMTYETEQARELNEKVASERQEAINKILAEFKVGARTTGYTIGPSITRFSIEYEPNVSVKSVEKLEQDISLRLGGVSSRFAAIIPGEAYSGFEVPNATVTTVSFKDVFTSLPDVKKHPLAVAFGMNISGDVIYADFDEFPHLLVAGTTGSGKSIYIHSIITTLIMKVSPDDLRIVLVDPKKVEMTKYRDMPHLLCPIITEAEKAKVCLQKLVAEMERRYDKFSLNPEISNIKQYNEWAKENNEETFPYIIAVIDEYADLVDNCKEISQPVVSIAQKARGAGIHLLISTQRPSTNVITGVIKGNLPTHVALMTSSYTDSITIIGEGGAERLLGKGDMLVQSPLVSRVGVTRLQGCFIQNKEIVHVVNYLKEHYETQYDENYLDLVDHSKDPVTNVLSGDVEKEASEEEENKYQSIKEWVMSQEFVSMSKIQRECSVGFNRAGRFFTRLQKEGVVATTQDGSSKGCRVLIHDKYYDDGDSFVSSDELIN